MSIDIEVPIQISEDRVRDLLVTAFEGGINYWALVRRHGYDFCMSSDEFEFPEDFRIMVEEWDDERKKIATHKLDMAAIKKGLELMANYPNKEHWNNFIRENEDVCTGDVFVQLALLGEIRYG